MFFHFWKIQYSAYMKTKRRSLLLLRLCKPVLHVVIILLLFFAVVHLRATTDLIPWVQLRIPVIDMMQTMLFASISACIFLVAGYAFGLYVLFKPTQTYYMTFVKAWWLWLVVSSFVAYMWFGYVFVDGISRFVLLVWGVAVLVVLTILESLLLVYQNYLERKCPYKVLLIADKNDIAQKVKQVLWRSHIYELTLSPVDTKYVTDIYDMVVVAGSIQKNILQAIGDIARIQWQIFYHVGDTLFLEDLISVPQRLWWLMVLEYKASPLTGWWRVMKRLFDIVWSVIFLLVLFPLMLIIAVLIKIDSPGSVLYIQKRIGKNKKIFHFIKFRSMYTHLSVGDAYGWDDADALYAQLIASEKNTRTGVLSKIQDDPRVTRVWRWLRKISLDELPSLWSVLIGDMSLVWPRPHMPHEVDQYDTWQERLFSIKPGITGYAQIFGRHNVPFDEEAMLDLYYIQHWSFVLDMYVLVSTVQVVFEGR